MSDIAAALLRVVEGLRMTHRYSSWTLLLSVGSIGLVLGCRSSPSGTGGESTGKAGAAETRIGVARCDEYLAKVRRCISERAPTDKRQALEKNLAQQRASWVALAANPGTRPSLDQSCGFALKSARVSLQKLSCEW